MLSSRAWEYHTLHGGKYLSRNPAHGRKFIPDGGDEGSEMGVGDVFRGWVWKFPGPNSPRGISHLEEICIVIATKFPLVHVAM